MRRIALAALAAILSVSALLSPDAARSAPAHPQCSATGNERAPNLCVVGVRSTAMNAIFQYQRTPVWCWAASMAMILAYYGRPVSQRDVVSDIFGAALPSTLPASEVIPYLDHTYVDSATGRRATTHGSVLYAAPMGSSSASLSAIMAQLNAGRPLLVFTPNHAMVLTALYYYADESGNELGIAGVVVRDPFPYEGGQLNVPGIPMGQNPGERILSQLEYYHIQYVFAISVH
jgi:hypothetical protein